MAKAKYAMWLRSKPMVGALCVRLTAGWVIRFEKDNARGGASLSGNREPEYE